MPALTRREYREEYLRSEEWKQLRSKVMTPGVKCVKCGKKATDPHHMRYRHIFDVRPEDLVPLCRPCHELVERAKRVGMIASEHALEDVMKVSEKSLDRRAERKAARAVLNESLMEAVNQLCLNKQRFICGIMKLSYPNDFKEWVGIITTQGKVEHLYWAVKKYSRATRKRRNGGTLRKGVKIHY
jgi:hypothetical protein